MLPLQVPFLQLTEGVAQPHRATCLPFVNTCVTLPACTQVVSEMLCHSEHTGTNQGAQADISFGITRDVEWQRCSARELRRTICVAVFHPSRDGRLASCEHWLKFFRMEQDDKDSLKLPPSVRRFSISPDMVTVHFQFEVSHFAWTGTHSWSVTIDTTEHDCWTYAKLEHFQQHCSRYP